MDEHKAAKNASLEMQIRVCFNAFYQESATATVQISTDGKSMGFLAL